MGRYLVRRLVVGAACLLLAVQTARVEASRGEIGPIAGPVGVLPTTLATVSQVVVDDHNKRVYIVSRTENSVLSVDFLGNQIAFRTDFAQPSAIAVGGGSAYALLSGTGQVVRLDPHTLAPTVIASGLVEAGGLAYSADSLYTFTRLDADFRVLKKINATSGVVTVTSIRSSSGNVLKLHTFAQHPGILYGSGAVSYRWDLASEAFVVKTGVYTELAALPNGNLISGTAVSDQPVGVFERNPVTFEPAGLVWAAGGLPQSWAVGTVALAFSTGHQLDLASVDQPGKRFRRYTFGVPQTVTSIKVAMSADATRVFAVTDINNSIHVYALPGVAPESAPAAPSGSASWPRSPAPNAPGAAGSRTAASGAAGNSGWVMSEVSDIEFAADGSVYVSDRTNGVVNRVSAEGAPISGWRYLAGVESLAELNGTMYGVVRDDGAVVRFNQGNPERSVVASGILGPSGLTAANGKLWTTYLSRWNKSLVASVDPLTSAVWRQSDEFCCDGFTRDEVNLAEVPVADHLLGYRSYNAQRFSLNTLEFTTDSLSTVPPFAVSPNGQWVIDGNGERWSASPFQRDAFSFPGTGHALSGSTVNGRAYVAAFTGTGADAFVVYDEANPGSIVYRQPRVDRRVVTRMEFRPGTSELWVAVKNTETFDGEVAVFPVDIGPAVMTARVSADADVQFDATLSASRFEAALARQASLASMFLQPGDLKVPLITPVPPVPSSSVTRPTALPDPLSGSGSTDGGTVHLTPATTPHPDAVPSAAAPGLSVPLSTRPQLSTAESIPTESIGASSTIPTSSLSSVPSAAAASKGVGTTAPRVVSRKAPIKQSPVTTKPARRVSLKRPPAKR